MIGGAVAWLVARGLSSIVAYLIVGGVIAALVTAAGLTIHHVWDTNVSEPYRIEGDERTTKHLKPQIDALQKKVETTTGERDNARADLRIATDGNAKLLERIDGEGGLVAQNKAAAASVATWKSIADRLRKSNIDLLRKLDGAIAAAQPAVDAARAIAAGPAAASFEESCREADRILGDLAKRMHVTS